MDNAQASGWILDRRESAREKRDGIDLSFMSWVSTKNKKGRIVIINLCSEEVEGASGSRGMGKVVKWGET